MESPARADGAPGDAGCEDAVAARLRALEGMSYGRLRIEWRRLYRAHPPKRVARDLLVLGVAWKVQEQAYGGLGAATKRRLADLAKTMEQDGDLARRRVARLKPGARLVREWRGQSHTVIVLEDGFEWQGKRWRSLSVIAREITGAHNTTVPGFVHGLVEPHRDEGSGRRCMGLFQFGQADVTRHGQSAAAISSPLKGFYPTLFLQIVCKEADLASLPIYG